LLPRPFPERARWSRLKRSPSRRRSPPVRRRRKRASQAA
jgi:hypothetical protein